MPCWVTADWLQTKAKERALITERKFSEGKISEDQKKSMQKHASMSSKTKTS